MQEQIQQAEHIVVVQADNPDGDSLSSALALEHILGDLGKTVSLYCGVDIPDYLKYMSGWDRVNKELPSNFDLSIIVDTSALSLLETVQNDSLYSELTRKTCIVIDHHHEVVCDIPYATTIINKKAASTTELLYELCSGYDWPMSTDAKAMIAYGILSDTLGLTTDSAQERSVYILAEIVGSGVSLADLDENRKKYNKKSRDIVHYKGRLLSRIEFLLDNRLASVTIPWEEIKEFSNSYNPAVLVLDEMRMTEDVEVALVYKLYKDGKITCKIRCNRGSPIANKLAETYGGGGHAYAAGFKIQDGSTYQELKNSVENTVLELLNLI